MIQLLGNDKLYNYYDLEIFDFKMTFKLQKTDEILGQGIVLKDISCGIGIKKEGYNLHAMGKHGSETNRVARDYL